MRGDTVQLFSVRALRRTCAALICAAALACVAQDGHPPATQSESAPAAGQAPSDSKSETTNPAKLTHQQKAAVADGERKKAITDGSTQLLHMALALKAEVDKTTKDTLSINVIRKADEIEKLAHNVKEKMKQSAGAS